MTEEALLCVGMYNEFMGAFKKLSLDDRIKVMAKINKLLLQLLIDELNETMGEGE